MIIPEKPGLDVTPHNKSLPVRASVLILLLVYSFVASFTYQAFAIRDPFFTTPQVDEYSNLLLARNFLEQGFDTQTFWQEPLTFLYFAALIKIGIEDISCIKFFHLFILNPMIILLLFRIARHIIRRQALAVTALYALSPLPLFLSLTAMKTLPAVLLTLLTLYGFTRFFIAPGKRGLGVAFVLYWSLAWTICQHLLLFLPLLLFFAVRRIEGKCPAGRNNLLMIALLSVFTLISGISLASWITKTPLLTLTTNGRINFHLANNQKVAKTMSIWPGPEWIYYSNLLHYELDPSEESGISISLPDGPGEWIELYGKKLFWEFTPHAYFRQFSWESAVRTAPWMVLHAPLTLVMYLLILAAVISWRRQGRLLRAMISCWLAYHAVNILFIPGIARYNAVIWPLTALLAVSGWLMLFRNRRITFLLIPFLCLWLSHPPNGFLNEYQDFMKTKMFNAHGSNIEVIIPRNTAHLADYRWQRGAWLFQNGRYAAAEALLQQTPDWEYHGLEYAGLIVACQKQRHHYLDALETASRCVNWPENDTYPMVRLAIDQMGKMLEAYSRAGRLDKRMKETIRAFLNHWLSRTPDDVPIRNALRLLDEFPS